MLVRTNLLFLFFFSFFPLGTWAEEERRGTYYCIVLFLLLSVAHYLLLFNFIMKHIFFSGGLFVSILLYIGDMLHLIMIEFTPTLSLSYCLGVRGYEPTVRQSGKFIFRILVSIRSFDNG